MTDVEQIEAANVRVAAATESIRKGIERDEVGDDTTPRRLRQSIAELLVAVGAINALLRRRGIYSGVDVLDVSFEVAVDELETVIESATGQPADL